MKEYSCISIAHSQDGWFDVREVVSHGSTCYSHQRCPGNCKLCKMYTCEATKRLRGTRFNGIEEVYGQEQEYAASRAALYARILSEGGGA